MSGVSDEIWKKVDRKRMRWEENDPGMVENRNKRVDYGKVIWRRL